jgi:3-oxoacyl-[acyl-carrier-protein] synthase-1
MATHGAVVLRTGMVTAVGLGAAQTFTSVQSGVAAFNESSVHDSGFQPIVMALLPEDALPALAPAVEEVKGLTSRQRRLLRLATPAFQEVLDGLAAAGIGERTPLFLATPERHPDLAAPIGAQFLDHLAAQLEPLGVRFDRARSRCVATGRAGGLLAMAEALKFLESGAGDHALAGGVDSFLDLMLLATLDRDKRIKGPRVMDGFIPGEGAGVVLLGRPGAAPVAGLDPMVRILGVGVGTEPGHRYSKDTYRGDGLAAAFTAALKQGGKLRAPVATMFAGLNGESFGAKEYGVASLRSSEALSPTVAVEHPVDCFGDLGAALGPIMVGLAAEGLKLQRYEAPALVWCSSDGPERAVALLEVVEPRR